MSALLRQAKLPFRVFFSLCVFCRPYSDQVWIEVAKRYQQIIEKDIKLRRYLRRETVVPHITFQTDSHGAPKPVNNNRISKNNPLPTSAFPVVHEKEKSLNVTARRNERKDTETFPKIVKVFSLNPSLPAQYFQDNVSVKITANGITAEPVSGEFSKNNVSKQNEIRWSRSSESLKEKGNLIDHNKNLMQASRGVAKETNQCDVRFQMNQRADILDYIDINIGECEAKTGSLLEGDCVSEMQSSLYNSVVKNDVHDKDVMVSVNEQFVPEQIYSDDNAKSKRKRRKRKAIFGIRRSKKRCLMGDLYYVKGNNQHELDDDKLISDGANNKRSHSEGWNSLKDADMGISNISMDQKSNDNEKQSQEKIQGNSDPLKDVDEKYATILNTGQKELKSTGMIDSENDSGSSTSVTSSSLHGNDIRQNKILDLKAKLAQQEQELQNLKRWKKLEDEAEKEDFVPYAGRDEADLEPMDDDAFLNYETIFDFGHQADVVTWAQDKEKKDELDLGKIEDLIDSFQREIKSFRIIDSEFYSAGRVTGYDHRQTSKYVVSENYKRLFAGIDNQMRFLPEDFASKDEFLFQLGLLRIYNQT